MTAEILIALGGLILAVITFFAGKNAKAEDDGQEYGRFIGEIKTDINYIKKDIAEIKTYTAKVDEKIEKAIKAHEEKYHSN